MANRPVYVPCDAAPFYRAENMEFEWNGGFAKVQSQKNIANLHNVFARRFPGKKALEISSKSMQEGGEALGAFFLKKMVPEIGMSVPVECVYQAGKTFTLGGPYRDLLNAKPKDAKRDERLKNSGILTCFYYEGHKYPLIPRSAFYNFIYMNALLENPELAEVLLEYDGFTDIVFNPNKGLNCQAAAAAAFVSLTRAGKIEEVKNFKTFMALYGVDFRDWDKGTDENAGGNKSAGTLTSAVQPVPGYEQTDTVTPGNVIDHKKYGPGTIKKVEENFLYAEFPAEGLKKLGLAWCRKNCTFR